MRLMKNTTYFIVIVSQCLYKKNILGMSLSCDRMMVLHINSFRLEYINSERVVKSLF